jgi:hypothetical protein
MIEQLGGLNQRENLQSLHALGIGGIAQYTTRMANVFETDVDM